MVKVKEAKGKLGTFAQGMKKTFVWVGNKKAAAAKNKGNTVFCLFYNQGNCREGTSCRNVHRCNVLYPNGQVCNKSHPAQEHQGQFQDAW